MWNQKPAILIAEDDSNDSFILQRTLKKVGIQNPIHIVENGEEAIAYLQGDGDYGDRKRFPFPGVVITDLKMPKVDGFEILRWLKNHSEYAVIPVVVLSASAVESDVVKAYQLRANCYLQKPSSAEKFTEMIKLMFDFWHLCKIPQLASGGGIQENQQEEK